MCPFEGKDGQETLPDLCAKWLVCMTLGALFPKGQRRVSLRFRGSRHTQRRELAMPTPARLDADRRAAAWERLGSTKFDVLIIGGGVTGSGAALDAATRGLSVALV